MRHFSDFEKDIIRLIAQMGVKPINFGDSARKIFFPKGECALITGSEESATINRSILFYRDENCYMSTFNKLAQGIALISYLEREGLITLCPLSNHCNFFYEEDIATIIDDCTIKFKVSGYDLEKEPTQYVLKKDEKGIIKTILIGRCLPREELDKSLSNVFDSVIYPTHALKELVENDFVTIEERQFTEQIKISKEQVRTSKAQAILANVITIIIAIVSIAFSLVVARCCNKIVLDKAQFNTLINTIHKNDKSDL